MSPGVIAAQAGHPNQFEDEMLAMQLQLEEINNQQDHKGKVRADRVPDLQLAFIAFQAEVRRHIQFLNDVKLANSIAFAVDRDGRVIAELAQEEAREEQDRRLAMEMSGEDPDSPQSKYPGIGFIINVPQETTSGTLAEGQAQAMKRKRNAFEEDEEDSSASCSRTYTERQQFAIYKLPRYAYQCTVCTEMFRADDIIRLDCKDLYCPECLKELFVKSTSDMTLFPPRCCRVEIPLSLVGDAMTAHEMEDFTSAKIEVATTKRIYCSNIHCGKFIPPVDINADTADCGRCGTLTCIHCRSKQHKGECAQDEALKATLDLAETEGWRRCHTCRAMIELNQGCYHMTCTCGAELCYLCGVSYRRIRNINTKACRCPLWEEDRLLDRAEQVVDRRRLAAPALLLPQAARLAPQDRQRQVNEARDNIRQNHNCQHVGRFQRVNGGAGYNFQCEFCQKRCSKYILECRQCRIAVCEQCRRNRI